MPIKHELQSKVEQLELNYFALPLERRPNDKRNT